MLKVYLVKYDNLLPIILLASKTNNDDEQNLYEKYYLNFYEILLTKELIEPDSILLFCNFRDNIKKKQLQVQGSIKSDKDILEELNKRIKNIEDTVNIIISEYSANYLIELGGSIKIKSTNTNLNYLIE